MQYHKSKQPQWKRLGMSSYEINDHGQVAKLVRHNGQKPKRRILTSHVLKNNHVLTLVDTTDLNRALLWGNLSANTSRKKPGAKLDLARCLAERSTLAPSQTIELINTKKGQYYPRATLRKLVLGHLEYVRNAVSRKYGINLHIEKNNPHLKMDKQGHIVKLTITSKTRGLTQCHTGVLAYLADDHYPVKSLVEQVYFDDVNFDGKIYDYLDYYTSQHHSLKQLHDMTARVKGIMAINNPHDRAEDHEHIVVSSSSVPTLNGTNKNEPLDKADSTKKKPRSKKPVSCASEHSYCSIKANDIIIIPWMVASVVTFVYSMLLTVSAISSKIINIDILGMTQSQPLYYMNIFFELVLSALSIDLICREMTHKKK